MGRERNFGTRQDMASKLDCQHSTRVQVYAVAFAENGQPIVTRLVRRKLEFYAQNIINISPENLKILQDLISLEPLNCNVMCNECKLVCQDEIGCRLHRFKVHKSKNTGRYASKDKKHSR